MGKIYIIRQGEYFKIGYSRSPIARKLALQTGNPEPLELVVALTASPAREQEIHKMFEQWRVQGEWFKLPRWLVEIIGVYTEHCKQEWTD